MLWCKECLLLLFFCFVALLVVLDIVAFAVVVLISFGFGEFVG